MFEEQIGLPPAIAFNADQRVIGTSPYPCPWIEFKQRFAFNPHYIPKLALAPYAEHLRGIATTWVNVTADKPGIGPGDVPAAFWRKTPQVIQEKATRTVSARNADHADFDKMMFAIGAKGLIEGVRK
ncbi:hypothetical protein PbB2_03148 [Candidatus Phycosocius bacilliformis]|uniref:Uncharacterized protein n=1 Tax=Candidatus Phycosocius bacilliformis TaxID=1445552 RepID=A0A2P2EEF7_9PROT|nr:hypothetical protein [Candidatus Phycosocius bacilliformis]GBF59448.1 hypothetical protein PbB2_03148 [Candidatus Phycosocius bacilliformis]